jgi:V8-like Glu-specific endopeptidase
VDSCKSKKGLCVKRIGILAILAALLGPQAATSQEFVGFDRSSFGSVVLSRNQSAIGSDIELELAVGSYNNESIRNYSSASIFAKIGLSVGRLDILTDAGVFPCTAFIVDRKYVLTNYHCVPGILDNEQAKATRIEAVQFVAGYTQQGVTEGTRTYSVSPTPVEAYEDLDYALLEVFGNPSQDYGMLRLAANVAADGDPFWVIGHPMGEAQRISREKCRANAPALANGQLLHTCDTLPGNSGSPVIDASLQMVVGLHHAGSKKDSVNFAIPMKAIIERSKYLTASMDTGIGGPTGSPPTNTPPVNPPNSPPDPIPDPIPGQPEVADICDTLYSEAKTFNVCYAYEAYAQQCQSHPFVGFAKGYIASNCGTPAPVNPPVVDATPKPLLRPWCGSSRLNPTETAICGDSYLAGLDEDMSSAYAQYSANYGDGGQSVWLRTQRDTCGGNVTCIANAVTQRIAYLRQPVQPPVVVTPPAPPPAPPRETSGNYRLSRTQCYATVASRASVDEVRQFIASTLPTFNNVRVFRSTSGYYGITVGTLSTASADSQIQQWKNAGRIPGDSYCHDGSRFIAELSWRAGGTVPAPRTPSVLQCNGTVINLDPITRYNPSTGLGFLAVRDQPSARLGKKVTEVYLGDRVRVLAQSNGWAQIECVSGACQSPYYGRAGTIGWSNQRYLNVRCN